MGEVGGRRDVEARASGGLSELSPCDPSIPVNVWDPKGICLFAKLWGLVEVGADVMVEPWCCSVSISSVLPSFIVVGDSGAVGGMGAVEEMVEMFSFNVGEAVHCQIWVGGVNRKLAGDPFQGASSFWVRDTKDAVVPVAEVVLLLVEDM